MKYLVIGAGGTGGILAGFLARGGKDVTLIARGETLEVLREKGITVQSGRSGDFQMPVSAASQKDYSEAPDVVFVCVKAYSLEEICPFLERICREETLVIPMLNGFGMGDRIAREVPRANVLDGCMYIFAERSAPGCYVQKGRPFRMVFGPRDGAAIPPALEEVDRDLTECGINVVVSGDILREIFIKMCYVSPMAAIGSYYSANAGQIREDPGLRGLFVTMIREVEAVAGAAGILLPNDLVDNSLKSLDNADPQAITSLQRDLEAGNDAELEAVLFDIVGMAKAAGIQVPQYRRIAQRFGYLDS